MITYLITSVLLSVPAFLCYRLWIRNKSSLMSQKRFLYVAMGASLTLPLLIPNMLSMERPVQVYLHEVIFTSEIPLEQMQQFCQCESPDYSHRLLYRSHMIYNALLRYKSWFLWAFGLAVVSVLGRFGWQVWGLVRLIHKSRRENGKAGEQDFVLLFPPQTMAPGAFRLRQSYIIWQAELNRLNEGEREAVFRHELSHIRQGNTFEKMGLSLLHCLWWANPVFYLLRKELELLSEYIADEAGLEHWGDRKAYAHLLLRLQVMQQQKVVSGFADSHLRKRIERILRPRPAGQRPWIWIGLLLCMQGGGTVPVHATLSAGMEELARYGTLLPSERSESEIIIYCPDCESVCLPE